MRRSFREHQENIGETKRVRSFAVSPEWVNFAVGMEVVFWTLAIVATVFVAGIRGWRRSFTGQVCAVTGFCIASLCAHIFSSEVDLSLISSMFHSGNTVGASFATKFVSSAIVYVVVYGVCVMLTSVVRRALEMIGGGILDDLFGALFGIFNGVFGLSIVMNLWLCLHPEGELLRLCGSDDANAPQTVLLLAPAVFGSPDACDLYHEVQLREARKISCNLRPSGGVNIMTDCLDCGSCCPLLITKNDITHDNA